ncbi:MAG TPA: dihydrolipoamide acetyltransferase family protein [Pseudonocardiaceae bacterium]|nr:dihydrolipoamide acetyltransferase family protein [Pseudonocardiaceae bacterium]
MATLLRMPEVAAGATEAVLSEWLVKENAPFATGDPIAVVETDKAAVEIAAETDGVILTTLVSGGTSVAVGAPMALLGVEGERVEGERADVEAPNRVFASPLARKLLKEAGVEPAQVRGTGPNGRIVRRDVERALVRPKPDRQQRVRRTVARRLILSKQTVPHFYLTRTARLDDLLALRERLNSVSPHRISINDLVLRAVGVAHTVVPEANVIWTDDAPRRFDSVDVGVAIASERGLVTPVLRGVEKTTPSAIAAQVRTFAQQADEGRLNQADLEGGTITVTNLGMFGVEQFAAIINPPQSAILAVGAAIPTPVVLDGSVGVATCAALTLSVDHRAIDGALAARWLAALVGVLEEPLRLVA